MADITTLEDDTTMRTTALNFLLSAGLLKPMKSSSGKLMFRGVGKKEVDVSVLLLQLQRAQAHT